MGTKNNNTNKPATVYSEDEFIKICERNLLIFKSVSPESRAYKENYPSYSLYEAHLEHLKKSLASFHSKSAKISKKMKKDSRPKGVKVWHRTKASSIGALIGSTIALGFMASLGGTDPSFWTWTMLGVVSLPAVGAGLPTGLINNHISKKDYANKKHDKRKRFSLTKYLNDRYLIKNSSIEIDKENMISSISNENIGVIVSELISGVKGEKKLPIKLTKKVDEITKTAEILRDFNSAHLGEGVFDRALLEDISKKERVAQENLVNESQKSSQTPTKPVSSQASSNFEDTMSKMIETAVGAAVGAAIEKMSPSSTQGNNTQPQQSSKVESVIATHSQGVKKQVPSASNLEQMPQEAPKQQPKTNESSPLASWSPIQSPALAKRKAEKAQQKNQNPPKR